MKKRIFSSVLAVSLITATFILPILNPGNTDEDKNNTSENVSKAPTAIIDSPKKPDNKPEETIIKNDEKVTFIIEINGSSLLDTVIASEGKYKNVSELVLTDEGKVCCDTIKKNQAVVKASIQKLLPDSDFSESRIYYAVINGFSVKAPLSTKDKIEKINGIKSVTVSDTVMYTENDEDYENNIATVSAVSQTAKNLVNADTLYDGSGMLIAVIDSEFNTMHEVFSTEPTVVKYNKEQIKDLYDAVGFSVDKKYSYENVCKNEKIIYAYDYEENDDNTNCYDESCHGTHIAALAAGNNGKDDESAFRGIAFNSQLALMKVSDSSLSAFADTVLSALDDCAKLGADIINISLGNERNSDSDIFREPFEKLEKAGTVIICPSGNSNYNNGTENLSTYDIDYSALNFISCYNSTLSVASSTNSEIMAEYLTVDGNDFLYNDIKSDLNDIKFRDIITEPTEYVYLEEDENGNIDYAEAENKIAVIQRDGNDFEDQAEQAFFEGVKALALIDSGAFEDNAYNNTSSLTKENIPVIFLDDNGSEYFEYYKEGIIESGKSAILVDSENKNVMSKYSSWGVTPDLKLKPEITSVGENVYSANSDGGYKYMSGTSVSTAFASGGYAVIKQYLNNYEWFSLLSPVEQNKAVIAVLMSNSEPVKQYSYENEEVLYVSPRKQGAGRVDIKSAVESGAYLEVSGSDRPKADLGDSMIGEYTLTFKIKNISDSSQTFSLSYYIQTDKPQITGSKIINTLEPYSLREYSTVEFRLDSKTVEEVTVESGEETEINAIIKLDELYALTMTSYFPNGFYVDGYAVLKNQNGRTLNLPFMGFCGEWDKINPFDHTVYDGLPSITGYENYLVAVDYNSILEPVALEKNNESIFISKNTVGNYYHISQLKNSYILPDFYLIRDAYDFTVTVSDINSKQLFTHNYGSVSAERNKKLYEKLLSDSGKLAEFFSNLSDGSYIYTISARTMTPNGTLSEKIYSTEFPFCVDSKKPEEVSSETYEKNGKIYLALTAKDDKSLNGFELYTSAYNSKTNKYEYADKLDDLISGGYISDTAYIITEIRNNKSGSVTHIYDITNLYSELTKLQFLTRDSIPPFSVLSIAYRAYDSAYNPTEIKIADAVAYKNAVFTFIDQNGKPAEGVKVSFGDRISVSDKNGKAVFDKLLPDVYLAQIIGMSEGYSTEKEYFISEINLSKSDYSQKIILKFEGEYLEASEESSENSVEKSSVSDESRSDKSNNADNNSVYALLFVGLLLFISAISLIISKQRRK